MSFGGFLNTLRKKREPGDVGEAQVEQHTGYGMRILLDQPCDKLDIVDIVAIHGLNGHYADTWTTKDSLGNDINWLKDLLPNHIPNSRIMSYSYNSIVQFSKSLSGIDTFAEQLLGDLVSWRQHQIEQNRPMIFICHSLGGLVFKQFMNRAHETSRYSSLVPYIRSVMFFGTPHRGSSIAQWADIAANILKTASLGTNTNTRLMRELRSGSHTLKKISSSFASRGERLTIYSLYETERMPGMNSKVVEDDSARLDWPNEIPMPMHGNHSTICKFSSANEQGFRSVWTVLSSLVESALAKDPPPNDDTPITGWMPNDEETSCLSALYTSDYELHKDRNDTPVNGTCQWILNHSRYKHWIMGNCSKLLVVSGDAGCGKSVLTSFLIDYESHQAKNMPGGKSQNEDNEKQNSASFALTSVLHQIYLAQPKLIKHAMKQFTSKNRQEFTEFPTLWTILKNTIDDKEFLSTVCFLDGLDECDQCSRIMLIDSLAKHFSTSSKNNHQTFWVLLTSRPNNTMKLAFRNLGDIRLKIEDVPESTEHDIEIVVKSKIDGFRHTGVPEDILVRLERQIIKKADRTFIWTTMIFKLLRDAIESGASQREIDTLLESRKINDIYTRMLENSRRPEEARRILSIVLAAVEPFTLAEMNIAMTIMANQSLFRYPYTISLDDAEHGFDTGKSDPKDTLINDVDRHVERLKYLRSNLKHPFDNYIYSICGHFLRIIQGKIYFVHQTAREFLSKGDTNNPNPQPNQEGQEGSGLSFTNDESEQSWKSSVSVINAHKILLDVCRDYILMFSWPFTADDEENHQLRSSWMNSDVGALLDYSTYYWTIHFCICNPTQEERTSQGFIYLTKRGCPASTLCKLYDSCFSKRADLCLVPETEDSKCLPMVLRTLPTNFWPLMGAPPLEIPDFDPNATSGKLPILGMEFLDED